MHQNKEKKAKFIKTPWGKAEVAMTFNFKTRKTKVYMSRERYKHLTNPDRN